MERYPSYKDSGVEWIGEIPSHWSSVLLKRMCSIKRGSSPRPIDDPKYFDENGTYSWVRISDVTKSERYLYETTERLSELGSSLSTKIEPNDIFLSIAGSVGKPIITRIRCCIHDGFVWFDKLTLNKEFLFYIFKTGQCFTGLGKWGTQLNLNTDTVGMITIPTPPPSEQHQIVSFLDNKTSLIDKLIDTKKRKIELLKEYRTSLINQVVTKGLNLNVEIKDSGVEWIGEIPSHYATIRLKYLCDVSTGSRDTQDKVDDGEYPFFVRSPKVERINSYSYDGESVLTVGDGVGTGKVFHYFNGKFEYHQRVYKFSDFRRIKGKFFYWFMLHHFIIVTEEQNSKSTVDSLRRPLIDNFWFVVPPISEQHEIVSYLDEQTSTVDKEISMEERKIELLKEYRQSLISEVVTGKIKVTNDE